jgi:Na+/H+ antiporter NhaC
MIMAWMLAGVLGTVLTESGLVQSLVWLAERGGVSGALYVGASFLVCAVVSTATGTSFGTILLAGPLLYPAAGPLGAPAGPLMGAVLGGSTFGDSISPVSDTTIASAGSQHTDVPGTVRSRLKYVLPAGLVALGASVAFAWLAPDPDSTTAAVSISGSPAGLPMLVVPTVVILMMIRRRHLLEGLFAGVTLACARGLALGTIAPDRLLFIDRTAFGARGLVVDGMNRAVGVSVFTLLLMGLVGTLGAAGLLARLTDQVSARARSARSAEWWAVGTVSAAVLLTTHSVVAVLAVGPLVRQVGERVGIHPWRRANLLDLTVCTWPFLLPFFLPTHLASSTTAGAETFGMPRLGPGAIGLANTYAWALVVTIVVAVAGRYGARVAGDARVGRDH